MTSRVGVPRGVGGLLRFAAATAAPEEVRRSPAMGPGRQGSVRLVDRADCRQEGARAMSTRGSSLTHRGISRRSLIGNATKIGAGIAGLPLLAHQTSRSALAATKISM